MSRRERPRSNSPAATLVLIALALLVLLAMLGSRAPMTAAIALVAMVALGSGLVVAHERRLATTRALLTQRSTSPSERASTD